MKQCKVYKQKLGILSLPLHLISHYVVYVASRWDGPKVV